MSGFLTRQKRYGQILGLLIQHDLAWVLDRLKLEQFVPEVFKGQTPEGRVLELSTPEKVRVLFEELGPTFVKMGQILSTRPDLIPKPYTMEFKKLQDGAKPLSFELLEPIINDAFDAPVEDVFSSFNPEPLASASIGQVHLAMLPEGQEVVVKIQRPDIEETIQMDLAILRSFADLAWRTGLMNPIDPVAIVHEFEQVIMQELDYISEGRKTDLFREQHSKDSHLVIPHIYWEFTRKKVMTMDFMKGLKISEVDAIKAQGHNIESLAKQIVNTLLKQVFVYGRFHSDPHPGNLMVLESGELVMIDFGMCGHFDGHTRRALVELLRYISTQDHIKMAEALLKHGLVQYDVDMPALQSEIRGLMRSIERGGKTSEIAEAFMKFIVTHKLDFPPDLFFLDKVFGTLDGAVKTLDPELQMRELARSFLPQLTQSMVSDWRSLTQRFLSQLLETDDALLSLPGDLSKVLKRTDAGFLELRHQHSLSDKGLKQVSRLILWSGLMGLGALSFLIYALQPEWESLYYIGSTLCFLSSILLFFQSKS